MAKYGLGLDFGTLSVRALIAEVGTGRELAAVESVYPHAVLDRALPDGTPLPPDWALQDPSDYVECLYAAVPEAVRMSGVAPEDIIGIGLDCTACTILPTDASGEPLCLRERWSGNPHAWVKLWKHHAAQGYADRMTSLAVERGEGFLAGYGGKVSSEWMLPKVFETYREAPDVYAAAARFVEAGDWLVWKLCGAWTRAQGMAGVKSFWRKGMNGPGREYLAALDPGFAGVMEEKFADPVLPIGMRAGGLLPEMAARLGLRPGTAVATANVDAHVALPPAGIVDPGELLMIMGTSAVHIVLGAESKPVPGICGAVEDSVVPGLIGYEAGQTGFGDQFAWFVRSALPEELSREARGRGLDIHALLAEKAARLRPGESGLLALDWWNGNRSVLVDADLTGLIVGMTLQTRPEEIYRAIVEATAFGTRMIIETFVRSGVTVDRLCACGGIAQKNPFLMQLFADVTNREIRIARSRQAPALGSAMFGAVAAGGANGGYDDIRQAAREMGGVLDTVYRPDAANAAAYDALYEQYVRLHDLFGRGGCDVMKRLKAIRAGERP